MLARLDRWVTRALAAPLWIFLSAIVVMTFARSGTWEMPNLPVQAQMLVNPFQNALGTHDSYLWWNWLSPAIAHFLGIRSVHAYYLFCLGIALLIIPAAYSAFRRHLPTADSRWRLLLFVAFPAAFTAFFWVGLDSLTILLLVLLVRSIDSVVLAIAYGFLLGLQHAEQAALALVLLAMTRWLLTEAWSSIRGPLLALIGVTGGRVLLGYIAAHADSQPSSRLAYFGEHYSSILTSFAIHLPVIVFSLFGMGWFFFARAGLTRSEKQALGIVVLVGLGIAMTAMDKTRVGAVATLPAVLALLSSPRFSLAASRERLLPYVGLATIVPIVWVWTGVYSNLAPFDLTYLVHVVTGHPGFSGPYVLWPF